jgi:Tfp pilus assembly protein PilF
VEEAPTQELAPPPAPPRARRSPGSRVWVALASAPLVVVAAVLTVVALRPAEPTAQEAPPPAAEPPPSPASAHLKLAARFRREGDTVKELYYLAEAVRADPQNSIALYQLGAALIQTGEVSRGCDMLGRAATYKPAVSLRNDACSPTH